jgi:hypothetical protein
MPGPGTALFFRTLQRSTVAEFCEEDGTLDTAVFINVCGQIFLQLCENKGSEKDFLLMYESASLVLQSRMVDGHFCATLNDVVFRVFL